MNPYFQNRNINSLENKFLLDLNALKTNVESAKQNLVTMIFTPTIAFLNVPNVPYVLVTKWKRLSLARNIAKMDSEPVPIIASRVNRFA